MQDNKKSVTSQNPPHGQTHATTKTAASNVDNVATVMCEWDAAPVATTSNGEPPPESEFESWLLAPVFGDLIGVGAGVGVAPISPPGGVDVAVVSTFRLLDDGDALEEVLVVVEDAEVVAGAEVLVLVCSVVRDVGDELELELELLEGSLLLGHSAAIPRSFWNTPIIDVSPTSTSAQLILMADPIFASPAKHSELQVAPTLKSEDTHPSIAVL